MPLKLKKRGDIWHFTGTVAGRRLRGSTKTSQRREAERIANEVESRELQGRRDPGSVLTFAQASIEYRKEKGAPKYLELVEDHWRDTPVNQITAGAVRRAAIELLPGKTGAYRNRAVIVPTLAVINYAAKLELCSPLRIDRFQEVRVSKEPATWDWVQAFMAHSSPHLGALACFMFLTAARISEALAVKWKDVDFATSTVRITMGKVGGVVRVAEMPPELVAALANIPGSRDDDAQVFPYAGYRSCADPWEVAIKRAGIKRLTPHCCRHGFATTLLHAGVDIITVAKLGGWASPDQLFRTYGHAQMKKGLPNLLTGTPQAHDTVAASQPVVKTQQNG